MRDENQVFLRKGNHWKDARELNNIKVETMKKRYNFN